MNTTGLKSLSKKYKVLILLLVVSILFVSCSSKQYTYSDIQELYPTSTFFVGLDIEREKVISELGFEVKQVLYVINNKSNATAQIIITENNNTAKKLLANFNENKYFEQEYKQLNNLLVYGDETILKFLR